MGLGRLPILRLIDVLVLVLGVPQREPEVIVVEAERRVVVLRHAYVSFHFASDLIESTINVSIVHLHFPDPEQSREGP